MSIIISNGINAFGCFFTKLIKPTFTKKVDSKFVSAGRAYSAINTGVFFIVCRRQTVFQFSDHFTCFMLKLLASFPVSCWTTIDLAL